MALPDKDESSVSPATSSSSSVPPESIRVEGRTYSSKDLANIHPGGPLFIKAFSGRDASLAFLSYHRRLFPHSRVKSALQSDADKDNYSNDDHRDFMELCDRVNKVLPRLKSFAPWHYFVKAALLLSLAFGLEYHMHRSADYRWQLSSALGLLYALIGLNIQHDANHGAISKNPLVNRVLGATQNWIGGSAISWVHQHVVQHHLHTNDLHLDPDMAGSVYVRLNPLQPLMKYHIVQHVYFFFLLGLYGFVVVWQSFVNVVYGSHHTPMSPLLRPHRVFETATSAVFFARWVLLPVYQTGSLSCLLEIAPMYVVGGYYLAFFFSLSHNFAGVHMLQDTSRDAIREKSFLYKQVVSSSNVGGTWLCFFNGGLNYQIEHHLFPRISHTHYPKIAPIVKSFCEERGVPYVHFPTVSSNVSSCALHLWDMGSNERPEGTVIEKQLIAS